MIVLPPIDIRALLRVALPVAALVALLWGVWAVHEVGRNAGRAEVRAEYNAHLAADATARADTVTAAREQELALQADYNALMEGHRREIDHLVRQHRADLERVQNRPSGRAGPDTGGVPKAPGADVGCTGEGLARPDAEFLIGYAADVEQLRVAFRTCDAAYRSLRQPAAAGVDSSTSE